MVRRLLYLNGIAILCVVLFHTTSWGLTAMFAWTPRYLPVSEPVFDQTGSLPYYWIRIIEQVIAIAVPTFLFVSGYFVAFTTGHRDNLAWGQIWGRIKSLLMPYTIWSVLIWLSWFLLLGDISSFRGYVTDFLTGNTTITFYYVPLLIQYYVLSPLIIRFARDKWAILLTITGLFQLILQIGIMLELMYGLDNIPKIMGWFAQMPKWVFLARLFWFVLGMVVGFHITQFKQFLSRFKWMFFNIAVVCIPFGVLEWEAIFHFSGRDYLNMRETIIDSIYTMAFIFAFLGFTDSPLLWYSRICDLGAKSFGIYITHITVMDYVAKAIYRFVPWLLGVQILFQPIILLVGLGAPLVLMYAVEKTSMRKYYSYLFG